MIKIRIRTEIGDILVQLEDEKAPRTTAHFMRYVDINHFDGAAFYRAVKPDNQPYNEVKITVIEGGFLSDKYDSWLHTCLNPALAFDDKEDRTGPHGRILVETTQETGLRHHDGTISLGRSASPDSVDDGFFICLGEQPELNFGGKRHGDGRGFSAFGQVVEGMDVVRAIHKLPTDGQRLKEDVKIISIRREA